MKIYHDPLMTSSGRRSNTSSTTISSRRPQRKVLPSSVSRETEMKDFDGATSSSSSSLSSSKIPLTPHDLNLPKRKSLLTSSSTSKLSTSKISSSINNVKPKNLLQKSMNSSGSKISRGNVEPQISVDTSMKENHEPSSSLSQSKIQSSSSYTKRRHSTDFFALKENHNPNESSSSPTNHRRPRQSRKSSSSSTSVNGGKIRQLPCLLMKEFSKSPKNQLSKLPVRLAQTSSLSKNDASSLTFMISPRMRSPTTSTKDTTTHTKTFFGDDYEMEMDLSLLASPIPKNTSMEQHPQEQQQKQQQQQQSLHDSGKKNVSFAEDLATTTHFDQTSTTAFTPSLMNVNRNLMSCLRTPATNVMPSNPDTHNFAEDHDERDVQINLSDDFLSVDPFSPPSMPSPNDKSTQWVISPTHKCKTISQTREAKQPEEQKEKLDTKSMPMLTLGSFQASLWLDFGDETQNFVGTPKSMNVLVCTPPPEEEEEGGGGVESYKVQVEKVPTKKGFALSLLEEEKEENDFHDGAVPPPFLVHKGESKVMKITWTPIEPGRVREVIQFKLGRGRLSITVHGAARGLGRGGSSSRSKKSIGSAKVSSLIIFTYFFKLSIVHLTIFMRCLYYQECIVILTSIH